MRTLSAEHLVRAYAMGVFPMAQTRDDARLYWVDPELRGIIPINAFHVPKRLARRIRSGVFRVTADRAFEDILSLCRESAPDRPESWINPTIFELFCDLHAMGHAHSVEVWREDGVLAGGLYGLALGGAFFGESMVSRVTDASKVALVHLVAGLKAGGFTLLDTQFVTEHLARFGAIEIPRSDYLVALDAALRQSAVFPATIPADPLSILGPDRNEERPCP